MKIPSLSFSPLPPTSFSTFYGSITALPALGPRCIHRSFTHVSIFKYIVRTQTTYLKPRFFKRFFLSVFALVLHGLVTQRSITLKRKSASNARPAIMILPAKVSAKL